MVCGALRGELTALIAFDEEVDGRGAEAEAAEAAQEKAAIKAAEGVWEEAVSASIAKTKKKPTAADTQETSAAAPESKKAK